MIDTWALVDSGADYCLFPASIAYALGISIPNRYASPFSGTADSPQLAYFETVSATIWNGTILNSQSALNSTPGFATRLSTWVLGCWGRTVSSHASPFASTSGQDC